MIRFCARLSGARIAYGEAVNWARHYESNPMASCNIREKKYLSDEEVRTRLGISRGHVWRKARDPEDAFPKPVRIGANCTRWRLTDLEAWEAKL